MTINAITLEQFTGGRLNRDDPETQRQLDAALAAAQRYCGWHVTPIVETEITLDGNGELLLMLPTLKLIELGSISEDGEALELTDLDVSARGMIQKKSKRHWTSTLGGIVVDFAHGYDSAPDFESVIFGSIARGGFSDGDKPTKIGPFEYATSSVVTGPLLFTSDERAILDLYRIERQ